MWGRWCRGPNLPPFTPCTPDSLSFTLISYPQGFCDCEILSIVAYFPRFLSLPIHNKEFLPPVLPSLTSLSTFLLESHNPLLPQYKWFNIKLLVGLCFSFTIIKKEKKKQLIGTASLQVTFEGIKGPSFQSDIAIDDVSIVDGSCPGQRSNEFVRRKETVVIIFLQVQFNLVKGYICCLVVQRKCLPWQLNLNIFSF